MSPTKYIRSENVDEITISVDEVITLESLRRAVIGERVYWDVYIELPCGLELKERNRTDEEGVLVETFVIECVESVDDVIEIGFKHRDTQEKKLSKKIRIKSTQS